MGTSLLPGASRPPRRLLRAAALVGASLGLFALYACSLIVETRDQQCQRDEDCATVSQGASAKCDPASHVCVASSVTTGSTSSSSSSTSSSASGQSCDVDGGIDGGGCYACEPTAPNQDIELLNRCTNGCIPFDDGRVVGKLLSNGMLPPLPTPGPDGGF